MSCVLPVAAFVISIDLELDPLRPSRDQQRSLEAATDRLVRLLGRYQMPATWAVADPAMSAATELLTSADVGHEIAVLGDPTWVGSDAGRTRFGRELTRRVTHARAAGLNVSTLALRGVEQVDHLDLLVKQNITVVRGEFREQRRGWFTSAVNRPIQTLRFGLWDVPASQHVPDSSRWTFGGGVRSARRGIAQAIAARGVYHVQVDGLSFATHGSTAERAVEQMLHFARSTSQTRKLELATLATVGCRLVGDRTPLRARSILHPAA